MPGHEYYLYQYLDDQERAEEIAALEPMSYSQLQDENFALRLALAHIDTLATLACVDQASNAAVRLRKIQRIARDPLEYER